MCRKHKSSRAQGHTFISPSDTSDTTFYCQYVAVKGTERSWRTYLATFFLWSHAQFSPSYHKHSAHTPLPPQWRKTECSGVQRCSLALSIYRGKFGACMVGICGCPGLTGLPPNLTAASSSGILPPSLTEGFLGRRSTCSLSSLSLLVIYCSDLCSSHNALY